MNSPLQNELETYQRELPNIREQAGKFVLIRGKELLSVWSSYEDAIQEGYSVCGVREPFLVKKIEAIETVNFNSRSVDHVCQP